MIKLEGGSDYDLGVLDLPDPEEEDKKPESTVETSERREGKRKKERKESKEVSTCVYLQRLWNRNRNAFRFRSRNWIRIQNKME